jgi:KDEL-tailed cysteine endopeptidase
MKRNVKDKKGLCGIAMAASYPVKTSPNPKQGDILRDEL